MPLYEIGTYPRYHLNRSFSDLIERHIQTGSLEDFIAWAGNYRNLKQTKPSKLETLKEKKERFTI